MNVMNNDPISRYEGRAMSPSSWGEGEKNKNKSRGELIFALLSLAC